MRVNRRLGACLTVVTAAAALTGCGGGGSAAKNTESAPPASGGSTIAIKGFAFSPDSLTVKPGQEITVTNKDSAKHTITADDMSFDSKDLGLNKTYTFKAPAKAGKYTYICDIHQYMKGTLTVS
jgi:plastocyanin